VAPLEAAGYEVGVFVATYECPGRDHNVWTSLYGPRAVVDVAPASRWRGETQGDTLRRALKLLPGPVDYVVVARPDVLFVTEVFPPAVLRSKALVIFHARLDGAVTDKLHVLRGEGIACFIQSITNGNSRCFNHTADSEDDDDDGSYESGESCYGPVESLVDAKNVAFLRDLIPGTRVGTFGDNQEGDSIYRVVPRSLSFATVKTRAARLGVPVDALGAYAGGSCRRCRVPGSGRYAKFGPHEWGPRC